MTIDWNEISKQLRFAVARPLHPQGVVWVGLSLLFTLLSVLAGWPAGGFWLSLTVLFYICFRDPARVPPNAPGAVVAPADGLVTKIEFTPWPPEAEQTGHAQRITINPRFYDVHVLRAPLASALTLAQHLTGQWGSPVFDKTAAGNEQALSIFKLGDGHALALEVIAGAVPERMKFTARSGDVVTLAQPLAYASFGGEVRLYVADTAPITVQVGQRMTAGETVVATYE